MEKTLDLARPVCQDTVNKVGTVLLATDRSGFSVGAEREAVRFAKRYSSRLHIMSVLETNPEYETIGAAFYEKEKAEALRHLESVTRRAFQEGPNHSKAVLLFGKEPFRLIIDEAVEKKADLIVLGRRGRCGFMKVWMGRVTAKVVDHAPCNVLVVPRAASVECRRILVALDGSGHGAAAVLQAIGLAKHFDGRLIVVSTALSEDKTGAAAANVQSVVQMAKDHGIKAEVALTPGDSPHFTIVEIAGGRGVDLIVMGADRKKGIQGFFTGNSTAKVIKRAGCAVLIARKT